MFSWMITRILLTYLMSSVSINSVESCKDKKKKKKKFDPQHLFWFQFHWKCKLSSSFASWLVIASIISLSSSPPLLNSYSVVRPAAADGCSVDEFQLFNPTSKVCNSPTRLFERRVCFCVVRFLQWNVHFADSFPFLPSFPLALMFTELPDARNFLNASVDSSITVTIFFFVRYLWVERHQILFAAALGNFSPVFVLWR